MPALPDTGAEPLRNVWYVAAASASLRAAATMGVTVAGVPLVVGRRRDGSVFALADTCPHRGMPLRYARFDGTELECCYHGWRFDGAGVCTAIPALVGTDAGETGRIRVRAFPVEEVQGHVWVFIGDDRAQAAPVPVIPDLPAARPHVTRRLVLEADFDNAVLGLLDPAHGPYVHRSWFWRSGRDLREKQKHYAPSPYGFTMLRHPPSGNSLAYKALGGRPETEIVFQLPGLRWEHIRIGRHVLCNLTALTPIDDARTAMVNSLYWTQPWLTALKPLMMPIIRRFLNQDRLAFARLREGLAFAPPTMLLGDPDALARWYYRLKREYRAAQQEGRAFINPIQPQTLRWRT